MIGGNIDAVLEVKTSSKNAFGEKTTDSWNPIQTLKSGFLDFVGGDYSYKSNYKGKLEETTHIFICDYVKIELEPTQKKSQLRLVIDDKNYDVLLIDNPMGLNKHLEISLKYNEVI